MGIKNRILRRGPQPQDDRAEGDTAVFAVTGAAPDPGAAGEHPVPAPVEPAAQGDPLAGPHPAHDVGDRFEPAPPEHEPQGDPMAEHAPHGDSNPEIDPADGDAQAAEPGTPPQFYTAAQAPPRRPGFRERGQLRRRLRFLREARELGYRDLGGLVVDQHRFQRPNESLVRDKVAAIDAVDRDLRAIEDVLAARRPYEELFVPGVSACQRCGALHGSDARYCPHCGLDFSGPRQVAGMWAEQSGAPSAPPGQSALFDPPAVHAGAPAPPT